MEHRQHVRAETKAKETVSWAFPWCICYSWHQILLSWLGEYVLHENHSFDKVSSVLFFLTSHLSLGQKFQGMRLGYYWIPRRSVCPSPSPHQAVGRNDVSPQSLLLQTRQPQGPQLLLRGYVFSLLPSSYFLPEHSGIKRWKIKLISQSLSPG